MGKNQIFSSTQKAYYTNVLFNKQLVWWKRLLDVQAPYRWNLNRLKPGFSLEIGCGIGRNLVHLRGKGIGIDHNLHSVEIARRRGIAAFTPDEFKTTTFNKPQSFDCLLLSHVAEHMNLSQIVDLLRNYVGLLKIGGRLIIITPQEAGFKRDSTHIEFMDFTKIRKVVEQIGFSVLKEYSFPFPRIFGRLFTYNEFVSISYKIC